MVIEAWHGTYQNNTSKISVLQKKAIRAINNLAYNEHTNAYFKCNKILKLSDQYKLQVSNYIFQLLHSNIDEEIESSLLINNQIRSHNTRTNNQMSILCVNRSKTKHCVFHNGMITWSSLPDIFRVNVSFSMFKNKVQNLYLEKSTKSTNFFSCGFSSVTVFGFGYCAVKFPIISFVVIIRIITNVIVRWICSCK